jgi:hypothetical protein
MEPDFENEAGTLVTDLINFREVDYNVKLQAQFILEAKCLPNFLIRQKYVYDRKLIST